LNPCYNAVLKTLETYDPRTLEVVETSKKVSSLSKKLQFAGIGLGLLCIGIEGWSLAANEGNHKKKS
jgi:hypothetical protein